MKAIDRLPEKELPLRAEAPRLRAATLNNLLDWALRARALCPGVGAWLALRITAYWDAGWEQTPATDATAALDLLQWLCGGDRAAVEQLATFREMAGAMRRAAA